MADNQSNPSITWGNQKWNGAAPIFKSKEVSMRRFIFREDINISEAEAIIVAEPSAWIKKYFNEASDEKELLFMVIIGINDKRFNSSPIQAISHVGADIDTRIPRIKVKKNSGWNIENKIKKREVKILIGGVWAH